MGQSEIDLAVEIVELLLAAYFKDSAPDRMEDNVLFCEVPRGGITRNYQTRAYLRPAGLVAPALLLRGKGPAHLRVESISSIQQRLRDFAHDNFYHVMSEVRPCESETSFAEMISANAKRKLADVIQVSTVFSPPITTHVFPLTPVRVESDFNCGSFYMIDLASLIQGDANAFIEQRTHLQNVKAWLGVHAPSIGVSMKRKRIVLGAVALALIQRERHVFTLGKMAQNYLTLSRSGGVATSSSPPHTPPLGSDIVIRKSEHIWLNELAAIIGSKDKNDIRKCKTLEYYYRAWFMDETDRCPFLFMALDSAFGQGPQATSIKIRSGIEKTLETTVDKDRLELLMKIRHCVLHGGAPDLFASSAYINYCEAYCSDPVHDLDLLTAKCLRRYIFSQNYLPMADPHADIIEDLKLRGLIASEIEQNVFVAEWP